MTWTYIVLSMLYEGEGMSQVRDGLPVERIIGIIRWGWYEYYLVGLFITEAQTSQHIVTAISRARVGLANIDRHGVDVQGAKGTINELADEQQKLTNREPQAKRIGAVVECPRAFEKLNG